MFWITLHSALPADGTLPEWLHLVPHGTFNGVDGRGPYTLANPEAVIAASMADGDILIDENHSTDLAAPQGNASPARGWIKELVHRLPVAGVEPGGLWGRIEWTKSGAQLIQDHAYKGVSPVMKTTRKGGGTVLRLHRAALTNTPNLTLEQLHHQQGTGMDLSALRGALGLPETATEAEILAAVTKNATDVSTHASTIGTLEKELGTLKGGNTELATLRTELTATTAELNAIKVSTAKDKATAFIEAAMKAGKPIRPALKDHYISRHIANAAEVEREINEMPSLNTGGVIDKHAIEGHAAGTGDGLTEQEKAICARMGIDPKKFADQKAGKLEPPKKGGK